MSEEYAERLVASGEYEKVTAPRRAARKAEPVKKEAADKEA